VPHPRQDRAEHDGGAQRFKRVLGPSQDDRWRSSPDPLQRSQDLADDATPLLERFADCLLAIVERLDALVGLNDRGLDGAHAVGRFDQLSIELAAVAGNRFDVALELGLVLERARC
jgi:hypothetical protein